MTDRTGQTWKLTGGQVVLVTGSKPYQLGPTHGTLHDVLLLDDWVSDEDCDGNACGHCVSCGSPDRLQRGLVSEVVEYEEPAMLACR